MDYKAEWDQMDKETKANEERASREVNMHFFGVKRKWVPTGMFLGYWYEYKNDKKESK